MGVFLDADSELDSRTAHLKSADALKILATRLEGIGFEVERPRKRVSHPVLFGDEGKYVKSFNFDGFRLADGIALEIEAGGADYNNRALLDLVKMSVAVDVRSGVIAVPLRYATEGKEWQEPFPRIVDLFDAVFANPERFRIPLEGLLLVGY